MSDSVRPEVLIARLTSSQQAWRVEAEARLIALGAAAVVPLTRALEHAHPSVRLHAVHALGRIADPRGLSVVIRALGDAENLGAVAIAAEKALVEWGPPARPALLEAALHGDEAIRPRALRALGKIGGEGLEAALTPLLSDASAAVRTQAAVALAEVLGEAAVPRIAPLLTDDDRWVRYGVAEALVKVGSFRGEAVLREVNQDPEEQGQHLQFWSEALLDELDELRRTGRGIP